MGFFKKKNKVGSALGSGSARGIGSYGSPKGA